MNTRKPKRTVRLQDASTTTHALIQVDAAELTDAPIHTDEPAQALPPLTLKQKSFIAALIDGGMTKTDAYLQAYEHTGSRKSAMEEGSRTSRLPQVKLELDKYSGLAESTMIEVMNTSNKYSKVMSKEGASYAAVAVSAAKDVLDRVHGKATQRVETTSKAVTINIDLTGVTAPQEQAGA